MTYETNTSQSDSAKRLRMDTKTSHTRPIQANYTRGKTTDGHMTLHTRPIQANQT